MKKIKELIINNWLNVYTIYLITVITDSSTFFMRYSFIDDISKYIRYITYVYFGIRIILMRKEYIKLLKSRSDLLTKLLYLCLTLISIFLLVNFAMTKNRRMLSIIIILLSAINVDYKDIFKRTMIVQIIGTAIITICCNIGILYNYKIVKAGNNYAYSLGFTYPSDLSQLILFSTLIFIYMRKEKISTNELAYLEIVASFTYFITRTKTDFFINQVLIIIMIMFKTFNKLNVQEYKDLVKKYYSFLFINIFPLLPIISIIFSLNFRYNNLLIRLNSLLSNRLSQTYYNFLVNKITLFGNNTKFAGLGLREIMTGTWLSKIYVDNEYIQMLFKEGIIVTILFVLILLILLIMLYKLNKYDELLMTSIYLLFGLINARLITLLYCPILFLIIPVINDYKIFKLKETS